MANDGWIKLYRQIQNNWLWETEKPFDKRSAWIDILLMVNHKKKKIPFDNSFVEVDKGERITSERKLAKKWGWSRTKVRNFLELLQKDNMLEVKKTTKRTTIKVVNFGKYQSGKPPKEPPKDQGSTREVPVEDTNKNEKNEKNEKKSNNNKTFVRTFDKFQTKRFKKVLPPSERPKFDENSKPYKAAVYLRERILANNKRQPVPDKNPKDMENWAIEMDRLNRLGARGNKESEDKGYSWKEIKEIIDWCQEDSFWKSNILSANKLRKKITQLETKMKNDNSFDKEKTIEKRIKKARNDMGKEKVIDI